MKRLFCCLWLLFVLRVNSDTVKLGTFDIAPQQINEFRFPLSLAAKLQAEKAQFRVDAGQGALVVPDQFTLKKAWPVLIICVPSGGSAVRALGGYTNAALSEGWAVLAMDGPLVPTQQDSMEWRSALVLSGLDFVQRSWPQVQIWPVALAGFSGGAKMSGYIASALASANFQVVGVFMGGCNEDRVTYGCNIHRPPAWFNLVPLFLSSGASDPIATPANHAMVKMSLENFGFKRLQLGSYEGGHQLNDDQIRLALKWFQSFRLPSHPVPMTSVPAAPVLANKGAKPVDNGVKLLEWQKKEAEEGRASSQYSLALRYLNGEGVNRDEELARSWLSKAAQQGDNDAYAKLKNTDWFEERRDDQGRIIRSTSARREFMKASGHPSGRPGFVILHVQSIKEGGCDCLENLKWEAIPSARAVETWE